MMYTNRILGKEDDKMKIGVRKPSWKKSLAASTKGRLTRSIKKEFNPLYGQKGMGWINNPHKAAYNKFYHKTTFKLFK